MTFDVPFEHTAEIRLQYKNVYNTVLAAVNTTLIADATLDVPASILLDETIAVSFQTNADHVLTDYVAQYHDSQRACVLSGACDFSQWLNIQNVPAGSSGVMLFPTDPSSTDGYFFQYRLGSDQLVNTSATVLVDVSDVGLTIASNVYVGRWVVVDYSTSPFHNALDWIAIIPDDCTATGSDFDSVCLINWQYVPAGASGR